MPTGHGREGRERTGSAALFRGPGEQLPLLEAPSQSLLVISLPSVDSTHFTHGAKTQGHEDLPKGPGNLQPSRSAQVAGGNKPGITSNSSPPLHMQDLSNLCWFFSEIQSSLPAYLLCCHPSPACRHLSPGPTSLASSPLSQTPASRELLKIYILLIIQTWQSLLSHETFQDFPCP